MSSDFQRILNLEGEERRAKLDELFTTCAPKTDLIPLYDAWASIYDQVCA